MKKVYICAPLGGDVQGNLEKAKRYSEYALRCGAAPVTPHFYALCLHDDMPEEREMGMAAGLSLLWFCDEVSEIQAGGQRFLFADTSCRRSKGRRFFLSCDAQNMGRHSPRYTESP